MQKSLLLTTALLLSACVGAQIAGTPVKSETVDSKYNNARLNWTSGEGGVISSVRVFEMNGKVAVCGAVAELKGGERVDLTRQVIDKAQVLIGDERVLQGVSFFKRHQPTKDLSGKASNCIVTTKVWEIAFDGKRGRVKYKSGTYQTSS